MQGLAAVRLLLCNTCVQGLAPVASKALQEVHIRHRVLTCGLEWQTTQPGTGLEFRVTYHSRPQWSADQCGLEWPTTRPGATCVPAPTLADSLPSLFTDAKPFPMMPGPCHPPSDAKPSRYNQPSALGDKARDAKRLSASPRDPPHHPVHPSLPTTLSTLPQDPIHPKPAPAPADPPADPPRQKSVKQNSLSIRQALCAQALWAQDQPARRPFLSIRQALSAPANPPDLCPSGK